MYNICVQEIHNVFKMIPYKCPAAVRKGETKPHSQNVTIYRFSAYLLYVYAKDGYPFDRLGGTSPNVNSTSYF